MRSFVSGHAAARMFALAACLAVLPGCYSKRFKAIDAQFYSLSAKADSLANEHARTRAELAELKKQVNEHEQTMRSLRAGTQTGKEEILGRIEQLESRLEEQSQQLNDLSGRRSTRATVLDSVPPAPVVPAPSGSTKAPPPSSGSAKPPSSSGVKVDPTAEYDQAVLDFTQGRFPLALTEFRAFVAQHGATDLGDNAQYGVGESFYAIGQYDSAAYAYRDVVEKWPNGDKVPAALYKLGIAYQKANKSAEARTTYGTLIEKYPSSGEAKLARERLKEMDAR